MTQRWHDNNLADRIKADKARNSCPDCGARYHGEDYYCPDCTAEYVKAGQWVEDVKRGRHY